MLVATRDGSGYRAALDEHLDGSPSEYLDYLAAWFKEEVE